MKPTTAHSLVCTCPDCWLMDRLLQRDPLDLIRSARSRTDDRFAFGLLLSHELVFMGRTIQPSRYLPQSQPDVAGRDPFAWRYA